MAGSKKGKYRVLINRLQGVAGNVDGAVDATNDIKDIQDKGILINDKTVNDNELSSVTIELNDAKNSLYRAIRSCYTSMSKDEDED